MAIEVLVVTPHAPLGKMILQVLGQTDAYTVAVGISAVEALGLCHQKNFTIIILDSALLDMAVPLLAEKLKQLNPWVKLIVFPPENNPQHPDLAGFTPDACLKKPFYLPDLLATIEKLSARKPVTTNANPLPSQDLDQHSKSETEGPKLDLMGPEQAAHLLSGFLFTANALAALVVQAGTARLFAGQLPEFRLEWMQTLTSQYWKPQNRGDLVRFIQIEPAGTNYLLLITRIPDDTVLSVLCPGDTNYGQARSRITQFKPALLAMLSGTPASLPGAAESSFATSRAVIPSAQASTAQPPAEEPAPAAARPAAPPAPDPEIGGEDEDGIPPNSLPPLFNDIPVPLPARTGGHAQGWVHEIDANVAWAEKRRLAEEFQASTNYSSPSLSPRPGWPTHVLDRIEVPTLVVRKPEAHTLLKPVQFGISNLTYTCLLIPRLPDQFLTGEISANLSKELPQLCLAFGWNLEGLDIQPGHLQWIIRLTPMVAPGKMLRAVRLQTSQRLFAAFPRLKEANPSGDFWYPGYLIVSGASPLDGELLNDYIAQARQRQ